MKIGYKSETQSKNLAWYLPRPKKDKYKGGMPLYCEKWLYELSCNILNDNNPYLLNLFCGMNEIGFRIDINKKVNPDLCCDIHELSSHLENTVLFDVILADPPYSNEESKQLYGTPKLNYKKWTLESDKFLRIGGLFMIYHKYVMPNPNPKKYEIIKRVFIGNRIYHVPRVCIIFKKIN